MCLLVAGAVVGVVVGVVVGRRVVDCSSLSPLCNLSRQRLAVFR